MVYLLTAIGLTDGGSSTVGIYTQTIHRTTQLITLFGKLSGIRTQNDQTKINNNNNIEASIFYTIIQSCFSLYSEFIMEIIPINYL